MYFELPNRLWTIARHFYNDPTALVNASLRALTRTNPSLTFDEEYRVIYRCPVNDAVAVVSGGGHEPSFGGFVGDGLLSASVAGSVFASPSAEQVGRGIDIVGNEKGVCLVIMNYTVSHSFERGAGGHRGN
jgi:dihydroxyacetone kinase